VNLNRASGANSLGGRSRVRLDVDTPLLGVKVEGLEGTVSAQVLENVDVLKVSDGALARSKNSPRYHRSIGLPEDPRSTCW